MEKQMQREFRTFAILAAWPWLSVAFIAVVGIIVAIATPKIDPLDQSSMKKIEFVREVIVSDENGNGFRVLYCTKAAVTELRLEEIRRRGYIKDSLANMQRMAPQVFGDMLMTDIYDFANFAVKFDPADIKIFQIMVDGMQKKNLYIGENPKIENWATRINTSTNQGALYIELPEIYANSMEYQRVYRYYKCQGIHQSSRTDEHFSHFSEDERIY